MRTDSILESPSAHRSAEESTTTIGGVGGGELLATTVADVTETPGAMAGTTEPSEVGARAVDIVLESGAQRPAASEEQVVCPEMP